MAQDKNGVDFPEQQKYGRIFLVGLVIILIVLWFMSN